MVVDVWCTLPLDRSRRTLDTTCWMAVVTQLTSGTLPIAGQGSVFGQFYMFGWVARWITSLYTIYTYICIFIYIIRLSCCSAYLACGSSSEGSEVVKQDNRTILYYTIVYYCRIRSIIIIGWFLRKHFYFRFYRLNITCHHNNNKIWNNILYAIIYIYIIIGDDIIIYI